MLIIKSVLGKLSSGYLCSVLVAVAVLLAVTGEDAQCRQRVGQIESESPQDVTISGKVLDASGQPVIGASLIQQGTNNGTITDINGGFLIKVPAGAILDVSCIGYKDQSIAAADGMVIIMKEDSELLSEVVVVGYGTQRKVDMTGAVSMVNVDEKLSGRSLSNVSSSLSGMIPGLQVTQTSSMAGNDNAQLLVRGLGTVNDASPLVVIDGMPDRDINRINLADVESISVLKDAASASIYGARAANGVILVTTKSGKSGKTSVSANASYAVTVPSKFYNFMDDYPRALTLMQRRQQVNMLRSATAFKDGTIDQWMALGMIDPIRYPNTDWAKVLLRNGKLQDYSVSATGGTDVAKFYASIGFMDNQGLQINNDFQRYNFSLSIDYKVFPKVRVGSKIDGNWSTYYYSGMKDGLSDNDLTNTGGALLMGAIAGMTPYYDGHYGGSMAYGENPDVYNPYASFILLRPKTSTQQFNGNAYISWDVFKGFTVKTQYFLNYSNSFKKTARIPSGDRWNFQTNSSAGNAQFPVGTSVARDDLGTSYKTQFNFQINYSTTIAENHKISAMAVYSEEYWHTRNDMASRNDRLHPSLTDINAALTNIISNSGSSSSEGLISYIGRIDYNAYDRYLLQANCRVDGSSKFAKGHRYGVFPSIALGWRFTQEPFLKDKLPRWFNSGKLRASYGSMGNNSGVGRYEQQETYSVLNYMAEEVVKGFSYNKMINKELSWETTRTLNLGLDLALFDSRLIAELDFYNKLTVGMNRPSDLSLILSGSYNVPRKNIGDLQNRGVELDLTWKDDIGDFEYSVNINGSYNKTRLKSWNEYLSRGSIFIDMPYRFLYTYEAVGIAQTWEDIANNTPQGRSPGDVLLKDLNGDGLIDSKDQKAYPNIQRDRPTTNFGITLNASWKGFDFMALFNGALGRKDYWANDFNSTSFSTIQYAPQWEHWTNVWSVENRDGDWARLGTNSNRASTYWLYDWSFLRLRNVQFGYNFPARLIKHVSLSGLRLYFTAENLFTLTKYPGLDPEKTSAVRDAYPITRSYAFGLNITF